MRKCRKQFPEATSLSLLHAKTHGTWYQDEYISDKSKINISEVFLSHSPLPSLPLLIVSDSLNSLCKCFGSWAFFSGLLSSGISRIYEVWNISFVPRAGSCWNHQSPHGQAEFISLLKEPVSGAQWPQFSPASLLYTYQEYGYSTWNTNEIY